MKDYQKYIRDLGFKSLGSVKPIYDVFKASKGRSLFTVKFGYGHVRTENKVLDRIGKVDGIVEKISFHELDNTDPKLVALVKKYIDGETLSYTRGRLVYPDVLVNAVNTLHENGVAIWDLGDYNIVLDPTGKPVIIDLCTCVFKDECDESFGKGKEMDLEDLEVILGRYT